MNESAQRRQASAVSATAGVLLRQARLAQGLTLEGLASTIKVAPRKLELLEADQVEQLPDATFTRALAQAICRTLKMDAKPVLALLPPLSAQHGQGLEGVAEGLNTPFHERPGRLVPKDLAHASKSVWLWVGALSLTLLVPAAWLARDAWWPGPLSRSATDTAPLNEGSTTAENRPATIIESVVPATDSSVEAASVVSGVRP